jgi:hypothetical protein
VYLKDTSINERDELSAPEQIRPQGFFYHFSITKAGENK